MPAAATKCAMGNPSNPASFPQAILPTVVAPKMTVTPDHYLPLLYVLAAQQKGESVRFRSLALMGKSISMLTVQIG